VDEALVQAQLDAVLDDLQVGAVKTGMLATAGTVALVARAAAGFRLPNLVVDPVMVATSGDRLLDAGAETAYRERLLPHALVATPNLPEASVLTGRPVHCVDDMVAAGEALRAMGVTWVLVKGGHLDGDALDVLVGPGGVTTLAVPRVRTVNTHGTGCSLAAAIAARLALGDEPPAAVRAAKAFVSSAVASAAGWHLGGGHGPIDHFGWSRPAADATGSEIEERSLR
jgi:hydroxymethylpyrimidine kinase/phosphomethylpyrimidine kinase